MNASPTALEIVRELISCPSVTPEDAGALRHLGRTLGEAGFTWEIVRFSSAGAPAIDNLYARFGAAAPNFVFAGHTDVVPPGDVSALAFPSLRGGGRRGPRLGSRRRRHEGRPRRGRRRGVPLRRARLLSRLDQLSRHRGRGGAGDRRHGEAAGMGAGQGGAVRSLHSGRADERRRAGRHDQERAARVADRAPLTLGKQGHVAYPHLADNPIRALAPILTALQSPALDAGTADSTPPTWRSSASMSAIARPT